MAKYKVGDKVRVRSDLEIGKMYEGETFVGSMEVMKGGIVTIDSISSFGRYRIKEFGYTWTDKMLESIFKAGDTTIEREREESTMKIFKIKSVKTINKKVVIVEFGNGDTQKAVCMPEDTFDFEKGIEVCVMKHLLGKSAYYKALKDADKQIKALENNKKKAKADAELKAKKEAKESRRKAARAERKRAARVDEMKEAYLAALKEFNGDADKALEAVK